MSKWLSLYFIYISYIFLINFRLFVKSKIVQYLLYIIKSYRTYTIGLIHRCNSHVTINGLSTLHSK